MSGLSTDPLNAWKGEFGDDYVARNDYEEWKIENGVEAFRRMIGELDLLSILEVGSNIGLNLLAIDRLLGGQAKLYAVEPARKAFNQLVSNSNLKLAGAWNCDAYQLPLEDETADLVFTSGVLIHIPPDHLAQATAEIVRVAKKYVMCVEYFSHTPIEVPYRGRSGLLFKRDFGSFYLDTYPALQTVAYGFLWQREFSNFDNLNWWLFRKNRTGDF